MMKKLSSVLCGLLFLAKLSSPATSCERGWYNDGGICIPCIPCPKRDLHLWLEDDCVDAFVDCPSLCRLPHREWYENELAGEEICSNLRLTTAIPPPTTDAPTTTTDTPTTDTPARETTTQQGSATGQPVVLPSIAPVTGDETIQATPILIGIISACAILGVILTVVLILLWQRSKQTTPSQSISTPLLGVFTLDNISATATTILIKNCSALNNCHVTLWEGNQETKRKPISNGEVSFGFEDGVRSQTMFTLAVVSKSDVESATGSKIEIKTKDLLHISPSASLISIKCSSTPCDLRMELWQKNYMTARRDISKTEDSMTFPVLSQMTYTLKVMELSGSSVVSGWKEEHQVSTPALTFGAEILDDKVHLQGLPIADSSQYQQLYVKSCDCVNGGKGFSLESTDSFSCPFLGWNSLPVTLYVSGDTGEHIVGETWIEKQGSSVYPPCALKMMNTNPEFVKALEIPLNPKTNRLFCKAVIHISNQLSSVHKPFSDDLLVAPSGVDFVEQYLHGFKCTDVQDMKIHTLLEHLITRNMQRTFEHEVTCIAKAVLHYHDCQRCRAHIHKVLHEKDGELQKSSNASPNSSVPHQSRSNDVNGLEHCQSNQRLVAANGVVKHIDNESQV